MNISLAQALATVLNIQVVESPVKGAPQMFAINGMARWSLATHTLDQAVCKAVIEMDLKQPSQFAIFPMGSGRENVYMAIERELLRQEQALGEQMWTKLGNDPRELVTLIMEQLREAAVAVINPSTFQIALLRTCCLLIACMTWTSDWIARLKMKVATLQQQRQQDRVPPPILVGDVFDEVILKHHKVELPIPPLFGAGGVGAIHVVPDPAPIESAVDLPAECDKCGCFNEIDAIDCIACGLKLGKESSEEAKSAANDEDLYICPACAAKIYDKDMPVGECCPNCGEQRA